jgi:hypothetical protein
MAEELASKVLLRAGVAFAAELAGVSFEIEFN